VTAPVATVLTEMLNAKMTRTSMVGSERMLLSSLITNRNVLRT
jgi:hypothetical protein